MGGPDRSRDRLWLWFAVASVACFGALAVSPVKDYFREYRGYQNRYRALLLERAGTSKELEQARRETVRVRQIWLPALDGRVDRCVSCHLGVEDPKMAGAPAPFAAHPLTPHAPEDFQRFGCVACHRGQGRATTREAAHGEVPDWDSPLLPLSHVEAACGACHLAREVPEAAQLSAGRALMDRAGCFGCHQLGGHEGWQSTAPDLDGLAEKTRAEWLRAWLEAPRSLRPDTWMPDFHLAGDEVEALVAFLWVQPPRVALDEVNRDRGQGAPPPGDYDRGRKLFRESRCISCHTVEGRGGGSAPELAGIASKTNRRWLLAFLADPHAFQPRTEMPRYAFTREDLSDLVEYITADFTDPAAPPPGEAYRPPLKLVEAGEAVYRKYGCGACHRLGGRATEARIGPELDGIGAKPVGLLDFGAREDLPPRLPEWLAAKIADPRSFREGLRMPDYGFSDDEIHSLVTALLSYTGDSLPESYRLPVPEPRYSPPGRFGQLVRRYRCLSCHQVQGVGGDVSTAPLTAEGSKVQRAWLERYLLLPTTIRPILTERMIPLRLPEEEAAFLAEFIDNVYVDDSIPGEIFPDGVPPEGAARGRRLFFERYGCQACHQVGGSGGYYGPPLDDSPGKLKSGWIAWWLRGPQRWRPDVRCPDYGLDDQDARDLAAFLTTLPESGVGGPAGTGGAR